ncbi:MAG: peptidoglycan DD-metalloendopeptidase family protein [Lachnospiraceae bacterium]|nr:peptidoglycan DD-metalloendopeptidase family protein [Lachnospiraceae bacterium]
MKKIDLKVKLQWNWYKAALIGTAIAVLLAPTTGALVEVNQQDLEENPIISAITNISFGPKTKVMLNGDVVALAKSEEAAKEAYKEARLAYNADGVKLLDVDVDYEVVDKEKDKEAVKGMKLLRNEKLTTAILESFDKYGEKDKSIAYTMRIDDYTVTVSNMSDVVSMLEEAQGKYDEKDRFEVSLDLPKNRNVMMYEVQVGEKATKEESDAQVSTEAENTGEGSVEESESQNDQAVGEETTSQDQPESATEQVDADVAAQGVNDGVKYVGFSEKIQVMETYVDKDKISDRATAYSELTVENQEPTIYVVQPGDSLSGIAAKYDMSVEDVKALNPGIESDDNIYYDDRLTVSVPSAAVQIMVQKQVTYKEDYYADVVYEDDGEMYIGESEVIQDGQAGTHTVTDLVTYMGDTEYEREQLEETVQVAAVAQIVKRGTKSKPTYMYPCTNWNITSRYGYRWGRLHAGTDVGVPIGTTVRASRGGQVTVSGWVGGYGNCVMIDHGDGVVTVYGHLNECLVSVGQYVNQGETIALSGNTGRSTGPHLHFEIRIGGVAVDPEPYLAGTAQ